MKGISFNLESHRLEHALEKKRAKEQRVRVAPKGIIPVAPEVPLSFACKPCA